MKLPIDVAISRFDYRKTQTCEIENRNIRKIKNAGYSKYIQNKIKYEKAIYPNRMISPD